MTSQKGKMGLTAPCSSWRKEKETFPTRQITNEKHNKKAFLFINLFCKCRNKACEARFASLKDTPPAVKCVKNCTYITSGFARLV